MVPIHFTLQNNKFKKGYWKTTNNRAKMMLSSNNGISRLSVKPQITTSWKTLDIEEMFTAKINEVSSPVPCGVKGLAVKPPDQDRLKESTWLYELQLCQKANGPPLNHLGFGRGKKRQREEGFHIWFFLSCSFSLSLSHAHCFFCNSDVKPTKGSWQQVPQSMLVWLFKISSWLIRTPAVLEVLHSWMSESASQAEVAFFGLFLFPDGFFEHLSSFGLQGTRSEWLVTENLGTANQLN